MTGSPVTITLMAISIIVYVGMTVTGGSLTSPSWQTTTLWGGNVGWRTLGGEYWRLLTAAFVHADPIHIGFNMWCLYSLGRVSERLFGKLATLLLYLLTGAGGAILSLAYEHTRSEVGASGAIFGLAGAILIGLKFGDLEIPSGEKRALFGSLIFFVIVNFTLGAGGNTDNMCHLGGFISGLLIGLPMASSFSASESGTAIRMAILTAASFLLLLAARELVTLHGHESRMILAVHYARAGELKDAVSVLDRDVSSGHTGPEATQFLGQIYESTGQIEKAILYYQRTLALSPGDQETRAKLNELTGKDEPQKQPPTK